MQPCIQIDKIQSYFDLDNLIKDFSRCSIDDGVKTITQIASKTVTFPQPQNAQEKSAKSNIDRKVNQFVKQKIDDFNRKELIQILKNSRKLNYNLSGASNEAFYTKKILSILQNDNSVDIDSLSTILDCTVSFKWTHDTEFLEVLLESFTRIKRSMTDEQLWKTLGPLYSIKNEFKGKLENELFLPFIRQMSAHLPEAKITDYSARYRIISVLESLSVKISEQLKACLFHNIKDSIQKKDFSKITNLLSVDDQNIRLYLFSCLQNSGETLHSFMEKGRGCPGYAQFLEAFFKEACNDKATYLKVLPTLCIRYVETLLSRNEPLPTKSLEEICSFLDGVQDLDQQFSPNDWISILDCCALMQIRNKSLLEKAYLQLTFKSYLLEEESMTRALRAVTVLNYYEGSGNAFCQFAISILSTETESLSFEGLIRSVWAFAIIQSPIDKTLVPLMKKIVDESENMMNNSSRLSESLAGQLYHIYCWVDLVGKNPPGRAKEVAKKCKSYIENTLQAFATVPQSSNLHRAVSKMLRNYITDKGIAIKDEHLIPPYFVDIALIQPQIAIEVQGPVHALSDGTTPPKDLFKKAVLENKNWNVLYVDHKAWDECTSVAKKVSYLQKLFQEKKLPVVIKL
jgi:very-short-patch-repair endonuclease